MKLWWLIVFFTFYNCSGLPTKRTDRLSILQGVTNEKEVEFSVMGPKGKNLRFEIRSAEAEVLSPDEVRTVARDFSDMAIYKMVFVRDPKKEWNLYAYDGEKLLDQRLVGKGQLKVDRLKLAVASCMDDSYEKHFKIWDALAARHPEYLILIGDNVYADKKGNSTTASTPESIWNRYTDMRMTMPLFFNEKLIPTHGLWDDHDFGVNDGGEDFEFKEASKEIFYAFFAQDLSDDDWNKSFGVGGLLSLGDFNFYFLDGRSFRSKSPDGRHLGLDQQQWLMSKIVEEATPSFLVKGDQFFGGYHKFESFEGNHPQDFANFNSQLKETRTPFIFLSGDRHLSEIMQFPRSLFGRPSFEITSSPIHAKLFPDGQEVNPWRVVSERSHMNFTIIENLAKENHWFLDIESVGENGEVFYRRELAVFIKDLQNNLNEIRKRRHGKRRYKRIRRGRR